MQGVSRGEFWAVQKVFANIVVRSSEEALTRGNAYNDSTAFYVRRGVQTHVAGHDGFAMHVNNELKRIPAVGCCADLAKGARCMQPGWHMHGPRNLA